MRRLGIVLGILGCAAAGYGDFLMVADSQRSESARKTIEGPNFIATGMPFWGYALLFALPILGFVVPWGIVRVARWLILGFASPDVKSE